MSTDGAVRLRLLNLDVATRTICPRFCLPKVLKQGRCTNNSRVTTELNSVKTPPRLSLIVHRAEITTEYNRVSYLTVRNERATMSVSPVVCNRHYETDITSWPGLDCAARGQVWEVSCPTDRGLLASRGLVPTGLRGGAGGGSDAGEAKDERALRPPGLEAELRGVSASPSLEASDISSNFTSSSEHGDCGVAMGRGTVPDAMAKASM